jgi:hypothetical protein
MSLWILLLGCASPPAEDTGIAPSEESGQSSWDWDGLSPDWTNEQVAEELDGILSLGLPRAEVICENILDLLARGDPTCPGHPMQISKPYVTLQGCTADSGYGYRGLLVFEEDLKLEDEAEVFTQFTSTADFEIIHPTGEIFLGGGGVEYKRRMSEGQELVVEARGGITGMWEDPLHEQGWLSEGISAYLSMSLVRNTIGEQLQITGALGIGKSHLYFDTLSYEPGECDDAPVSGGIWIRQPDSSWFQLNFDSDCGCPELSWNETESMGELCVDTSLIREDISRSLGAIF